MKRVSFLSLLLILLSLMPICAKFDINAQISPYFYYDSSLLMKGQEDSIYSLSKIQGNWETKQDSILRYFNRPEIAAIGFEINDEHVFAALRAEAREELSNAMKVTPYSNIPFIGNTKNVVTNAMWPQIGFIEFFSQHFRFSIGRRNIKWGPAEYDYIFSATQPYLDNIWIDYNTNAGQGIFEYNFVAVGGSNSSLTELGQVSELTKTFFAHRFTYGLDFFRFNFSEINCVYGITPGLLDFSPFILWHNIYQEEHSNVMIEATSEFKFDPVRFYFGFAMDDLSLKGENNNLKPNAFGFSLGLDWMLLEGEKYNPLYVNSKQYTLSDNNLKEEGGLHLLFESYIATNYLYNRRKEGKSNNYTNDSLGKFTVPWRFYSSSGGMTDEKDAYFLGFPYGGGSWLFSLSFDYEKEDMKLSSHIRYLLRGELNIDSIVDEQSNENWFLLQGNVDHIISSGVDFEMFLKKYPALSLKTGLNYTYSSNYSNAIQVYLGGIYTINTKTKGKTL